MPPPLEKVIFLAASSLADEAERRLLLDRACGDDAALRQRVEALFAIQPEAGAYLDPPPGTARPSPSPAAADHAPDAGQLGTRIGRYQLVRRIGEGGCGVVYLAAQTEPVRREVALKIIRLGMDTEHVTARFEAERQSLALMDHPNIARVLDAGATAAGRPFFVMELVDGERITDFCDAHRLGVRARLELFLQVCLAIQHAHQKGVIHRDLKPSNLLVRPHDGTPVAKVIDFGIAKVAAARPADHLARTAAEQFIGTPAYLSPELAGGGADIDTRSDIHSLGVVLHELLTGATPWSARLAGAPGRDAACELRRLLREEDPPAPSTCLAALAPEERARLAALRGTEPARLLAAVRGELDWIALKAMSRDRDLRHETASALAADVRRHLAHEPVSAGPPGRLYRVSKFIRRNRLAVASAALVALAVSGGFGGSTVMFLRERHARAEAEAARAAEAVLREHAEHRELVAQAAVHLSHGDLPGADARLARVPFDQAPLSLEAAETYSRVGEWHVLAGRWREATDRFATLALVLPGVDPADSDAISITLLPAAATLCLAEDEARYAVIRATAVDRFAGTSSAIVAEQVVKACLLTPAPPEILERLRPLVALLERAVRDGHEELADNPSRVAWCCFALALARYREGSFATARDWALRCLSRGGPANSSREAIARDLLAMIQSRLSREAEAANLLTLAGSSIDPVFAENLQLGNVNSFWFDWVNARVLHRETAALLGR